MCLKHHSEGGPHKPTLFFSKNTYNQVINGSDRKIVQKSIQHFKYRRSFVFFFKENLENSVNTPKKLLKRGLELNPENILHVIKDLYY